MTFRRAAVFLAVALVLGAGARPSLAQAVDTTRWCLDDGPVQCSVRAGNTIYLGGSFLTVGPASGQGVPVDPQRGVAIGQWPKVVGRVLASVSDGKGGWYVGGEISAVGGKPRHHLAHIEADGSVDPWAPDPNGAIHALTLSGGRLYVGGDFDSIGGVARLRAAALRPPSSAPLDWNPSTDSFVGAFLPVDSVVYLGGQFSTVGGKIQGHLAAVDTLSGQLTAWRPSVDDWVTSLAIHDTTLYVGGYFYTVNGDLHRCLAALGTVSGVAHAWDPALSRYPDYSYDGGPHVSVLLQDGDSLFVAGGFTSIGGQKRQGLAQIDLNTAQATAWNPRAVRTLVPHASFWALARSGDTLFVAGDFDSLGGMRLSPDIPLGEVAAALSASTATRFDWNPRPNSYVLTIACGAEQVYLGGIFTSMGTWVNRNCLAAIDATTGHVTGWAPTTDSNVYAMALLGNTLYLAGDFTTVNGQPRNFLAAVDATTGELKPWNPSSDGFVYALVGQGDRLLIGGWFHHVGGQSRYYLAAVDTVGQVTPWIPNPDDIVEVIVPSDSVIYVGGWFYNIGGAARSMLAALDPLTGAASPWNPSADDVVFALTLHAGSIYAGGWFHNVGGLPRSRLAQISTAGVPTSWVANADDQVATLAANDSTVFAGGFFSTIGTQAAPYFAAIDARSGAVRNDYPEVNGPVWYLAQDGGALYLGGRFGGVGVSPQAGFAALELSQTPVPTHNFAFSLGQNFPNPARTATTVRFTLPAAEAATLALYDIQGRSVAMPLSRSVLQPGQHDVNLPLGGLRPGMYLYRLEAGGRTATRKMLVIR